MHIKKLLLQALFLIFFLEAEGQILEPVKWQYSYKSLGNNTFEVYFTAKIEDGWHIYSQFNNKQANKPGPLPTSFLFKQDIEILNLGKPKEVGNLEKTFEKAFNSEVKYFSNNVKFVQIVKVKKSTPKKLNGIIEYMVCNAQQCLPPAEEDFTIILK